LEDPTCIGYINSGHEENFPADTHGLVEHLG
jgi:hypothetical protein